MFKTAILGFALAASAMSVPSTTTAVYHPNSARLYHPTYYPKGYYYHGVVGFPIEVMGIPTMAGITTDMGIGIAIRFCSARAHPSAQALARQGGSCPHFQTGPSRSKC